MVVNFAALSIDGLMDLSIDGLMDPSQLMG